MRLQAVLFVFITSAMIYAGEPVSIDLPQKFPKIPTETAIKVFLDDLYKNYDYSDDVFYYIEEHELFNFIIPFINVFKKYYPEKLFMVPSQRWRNPLNIAVSNNLLEMVKAIIVIEPSLVTRFDTSGQFDGFEPISYAVRNNDIKMINLLLPFITNLNNVKSHGDKELPDRDLGFVNLLSLSSSKEMDDLLIRNGIASFVEFITPLNSRITDNRVNIRSSPNTGNNIIAQLDIDTPILILGHTVKTVSIGDYTGKWVKIKFSSKIGWVLEPFIYQYEK